MDNRFEPLATGEVLLVDESALMLIGHRTFRVGELSEALRSQMEYGVSEWTQEKDAWFSEEGIVCEVLRFNSNGWQKGKVRINLEFCPISDEEENQGGFASADDEFAFAPPISTQEDFAIEDDELDFASPISDEDELDMLESSMSSTDFDNYVTPVTTVLIQQELIIEEVSSPADVIELGMPDASDFAQPESPDALYVEMELEAPSTTAEAFDIDSMDLELEAPSTTAEAFDIDSMDLELEAPSTTAEAFDIDSMDLELEAASTTAEAFDIDDEASVSFDDDLGLGEISQSIEQELELVEEDTTDEDDSLDLGDFSADANDDFAFEDMSADSVDDLDLGDLSADNEDEFELDDLALDDESENNDTDSLLEDVWQDMNQASWQNNP